MKKYLISGGAGFIGTNMVRRLLKEGNEVTVVDDYSSGKFENILPFKTNKKFTIIESDICSFNDKTVYDRVINLASPASPIAYQMNPVQTMLTNVQGTYNLLGLAFLSNARFLQASTSEVYGDPQVHPQTEDYWGNVNCYGTRSCYDEGKRCAETLVFDFQRVAALDARIVRIFNTYGPHMAVDDGRVVSNFIVQALLDKPLTIYGDGSQTRSLCYLDDTIEAILTVLEGSYTRPLNVGNPVENTMLELANAVWDEVEKTDGSEPPQRRYRRIQKSHYLEQGPKLSYLPLPLDDPKQRQPDISRIKGLYGWSPKVKLAKGLAKTVKYFKETLAC
jgi:UDP-glucuronate decarboxylase